MRHILTLIGALSLTLCACSGSDDNGNSNKPTEKRDSLASEIQNGDAYLYADCDTTSTWLGSGYDVTDAYLKGKREQIIDLSTVEKGRITKIIYPTYYDKNIVSYGSARQMLKDLTNMCEIDVPNDNALLFTGTVRDCPFIASTSDYSEEFQFIYTIMQWESASLMRLYLNKSIRNKYDNYLTDAFKAAIAEESADKVVERFGTHLLTDVVIGRCITTLYASRNTDSKTLYEGMYKRFAATIGGESHYAVDTNNPDGRLLIWLNGGNMSRLPLDWVDGHARMKGATKQKLTIDNWTLNPGNGALIQFDGKQMIPIYELVSNDSISNNLKEAVRKHISQRQLQ